MTHASTNVPILVYHHVYPDDSPELRDAPGDGVVAASQFRGQVEHLLAEGWRVVSTSRVVEGLAQGSLPEKAACLHFDNGWLDTATVVQPILAALGLTALCYPITDSITAASEGRASTIRTATEGHIDKPFMTWNQIGDLVSAGWEIGAHTAAHGRMGETYRDGGEAAIVEEVAQSSEAFERHLGFVPRHFAYPSGSRSPETDAILSRYYDSLRLWQARWSEPPRFTCPDTPPKALECQNIDMAVDFGDFQRLLREAAGATETGG